MREHTQDDEFEMLADLTSMLTLALNSDRHALERYIAAMPAQRVHFLLFSSMMLYSQAFARLGEEQGFDPLAVTRRIALREARERWGVASSD